MMVINWTQALVTRTVTFVTPFLFRVVRKLFIHKASLSSAQALSDKEVQKWNLISALLFSLSWVMIGVPLWLLLKQLYVWYSASFEASRIYIGPPEIAFVAPSLFGAMGLGVFWVTLFLRHKLENRFDEYCEAATYDQYKITVNSDKIAKFYVYFLCSVFLFSTFSVFRAKIVFYNDHFLSCGAVFCESHQYSEISEIGKATHFKTSNGNLIERQTLFIRYKDGNLWKPALLQEDAAKQEEVLKMVAEKAGLTIKIEEFLPER